MRKLIIVTLLLVATFVGLACDSSKCNCEPANAGKKLLIVVGSSEELHQVGDDNGCVDIDGGCDQEITVVATS